MEWSDRLRSDGQSELPARCGSELANLKELRPRSGRDVAIRILFLFDPWSQAVLLVVGNKARNWSKWYDAVIPAAEKAYAAWLVSESRRREEEVDGH